MAVQRALIRGLAARATSAAPRALAYPSIQARLSSSSTPTVLDTSFWKSLIPKPLRRENRQSGKSVKAREWNPATYFIVMFLLIGSMSIQMIALRNSFDRYMRQSQVRIARLRDVVERIKRNEVVDLEKALGTGEPQKEAEWEEVLRAIERDEVERKKIKRGRTAKEQTVSQEAAPKNDAAAQEQGPTNTQTKTIGNFF